MRPSSPKRALRCSTSKATRRDLPTPVTPSTSVSGNAFTAEESWERTLLNTGWGMGWVPANNAGAEKSWRRGSSSANSRWARTGKSSSSVFIVRPQPGGIENGHDGGRGRGEWRRTGRIRFDAGARGRLVRLLGISLATLVKHPTFILVHREKKLGHDERVDCLRIRKRGYEVLTPVLLDESPGLAPGTACEVDGPRDESRPLPLSHVGHQHVYKGCVHRAATNRDPLALDASIGERGVVEREIRNCDGTTAFRHSATAIVAGNGLGEGQREGAVKRDMAGDAFSAAWAIPNSHVSLGDVPWLPCLIDG